MPEVAVTVIWYVPDGVPPVLLAWCVLPPQPDENTSNSARTTKAGTATFLRWDKRQATKIETSDPRKYARPASLPKFGRPRHPPGAGVIPAVTTGAEV